MQELIIFIVLVSALKKIVNAAWGLDTMDVPKLAKYMRCLFQVAMLDDMEVAEQLLDLAHEQAKEAAEVNLLLLTIGNCILMMM
jgi:hypothetical protein